MQTSKESLSPSGATSRPPEDTDDVWRMGDAEAIREAVANAQSHGISVTVSIGIAEGQLGSGAQAEYLGLIR